jgi:dihydrofolate reductase
MRKIVAGLFLSLDGVYESPHEWHFPYWNDEMGEAVQAQMEAADTMLLGRVTFEEFAGYWPDKREEETPGAAFMNETPKLVVSNSLDSVAAWQNSTLIDGDVNAELTRLKEQPGKNINIVGSGTLVARLLGDGLLDELQLLVHPIVVGKGKRLFAAGPERKGLELADAKTFETGVLSLTYRPGAE